MILKIISKNKGGGDDRVVLALFATPNNYNRSNFMFLTKTKATIELPEREENDEDLFHTARKSGRILH